MAGAEAPSPRRVEADLPAAEALHRRTGLGWMMEDGARVRVTNPFGGTWTGRIIALADHPAMLLERDDGQRVMLPQCFAVEEVPEPDRLPSCTRIGGCLAETGARCAEEHGPQDQGLWHCSCGRTPASLAREPRELREDREP